MPDSFLSSILVLIGIFCVIAPAKANELVRPQNKEELASFSPITTEKAYRIQGARVAWINSAALFRDFPTLKAFLKIDSAGGSLSSSDQTKLNQWFIENFALIGSKQRQLNGIRNQEIPILDETREIYRPELWKRSGVVEVRVGDANLGMVDIKGIGHGERSSDTLLQGQIDRFAEARENSVMVDEIRTEGHSDGLMSLGESVAEATRQMAVQSLFEKQGLGLETVESYGVIQLPFGILKPKGKVIPAGIYVRQAHFGRQAVSIPASPEVYLDRGAKQGTAFGSAVDFGAVTFPNPRIWPNYRYDPDRIDGDVFKESKIRLPDAQFSYPWMLGHLVADQATRPLDPEPEAIPDHISDMARTLSRIPGHSGYSIERDRNHTETLAMLQHLRSRNLGIIEIIERIKSRVVNRPAFIRGLKQVLTSSLSKRNIPYFGEEEASLKAFVRFVRDYENQSDPLFFEIIHLGLKSPFKAKSDALGSARDILKAELFGNRRRLPIQGFDAEMHSIRSKFENEESAEFLDLMAFRGRLLSPDAFTLPHFDETVEKIIQDLERNKIPNVGWDLIASNRKSLFQSKQFTQYLKRLEDLVLSQSEGEIKDELRNNDLLFLLMLKPVHSERWKSILLRAVVSSDSNVSSLARAAFRELERESDDSSFFSSLLDFSVMHPGFKEKDQELFRNWLTQVLQRSNSKERFKLIDLCARHTAPQIVQSVKEVLLQPALDAVRRDYVTYALGLSSTSLSRASKVFALELMRVKSDSKTLQRLGEFLSQDGGSRRTETAIASVADSLLKNKKAKRLRGRVRFDRDWMQWVRQLASREDQVHSLQFNKYIRELVMANSKSCDPRFIGFIGELIRSGKGSICKLAVDFMKTRKTTQLECNRQLDQILTSETEVTGKIAALRVIENRSDPMAMNWVRLQLNHANLHSDQDKMAIQLVTQNIPFILRAHRDVLIENSKGLDESLPVDESLLELLQALEKIYGLEGHPVEVNAEEDHSTQCNGEAITRLDRILDRLSPNGVPQTE